MTPVDETCDRRIIWAELGVVVAVFLLPQVWVAANTYMNPQIRFQSTGWVASLGQVITYTSMAVPILFIAWRSGDPMSRFGFRGFPLLRAIPLMLMAFVSYFVIVISITGLFRTLFPSEFVRSQQLLAHVATPLDSGAISFLALLIVLATGVFLEEVVWRGFVLSRLEDLTKRYWLAASISSALFASYHLYEGAQMLPIAFLIGMIFAVVRRVTGSIWPGYIAHLLINVFIVVAFGRL